jgi:hypothetical protein
MNNSHGKSGVSDAARHQTVSEVLRLDGDRQNESTFPLIRKVIRAEPRPRAKPSPPPNSLVAAAFRFQPRKQRQF